MPGADLTLLVDAARAAGDVASRYFRDGAKSWDKADNAGPVTEADLAVNDLLDHTLRMARPDYGWLSEETPDSKERLGKETVFIIDPIDGTRSFVEGSKTWAHSLAIVRDGETIAGVVYLPLRDLMFVAETGGGAQVNGSPLACSTRRELDGANILATRPNMEPEHWRDGDIPHIHRHHRPSLAYRLGLVARGDYDAMLTLRPSWEWDIAAGALIAREAGACVTDRTGAALQFNTASALLNGVIAGGPAIHKSLATRLA